MSSSVLIQREYETIHAVWFSLFSPLPSIACLFCSFVRSFLLTLLFFIPSLLPRFTTSIIRLLRQFYTTVSSLQKIWLCVVEFLPWMPWCVVEFPWKIRTLHSSEQRIRHLQCSWGFPSSGTWCKSVLVVMMMWLKLLYPVSSPLLWNIRYKYR